MSKIIFHNSAVIYSAIKKYPQLCRVPALESIRQMMEIISPSKKCCGKQNDVYRKKQQIDMLLKTISKPEWLIIKKIMNVTELCYYENKDGKPVLVCF